MSQVLKRFQEILGAENAFTSEPMSRHTSFRVGGPADYYLLPQSQESLTAALRFCREEEIDYFVMGNGTNLLVSDQGYRGSVIRICQNRCDCKIEGTKLYAGAGTLYSKAAVLARDAALTGLEFAGGIPGTVGGAVFMNAGAYGGETAAVLEKATVLTPEGTFREVAAGDLDFAYRYSRIRRTGEIVWDVVFSLQAGDQEEIAQKMQNLLRERSAKQPLDFPSAGSTFKRPEGYFAGKLIMDAGLRGYRVGGAQVSEKHCGFVINAGGASASDIYRLMAEVRKRVLVRFGVVLQPEVRLVGSF